MIQREGLIVGAHVATGGPDNSALIVYLNTAKITMKGLDYIEEKLVAHTSDEENYSDEELENILIKTLYDERGNKRRLTLSRLRKLVPGRPNFNKIEWLLNNLKDKGFVRSRRLDSYKGSDGKMQNGDIAYEITPIGVEFNDRAINSIANNYSENKGDTNTLIDSERVFIIHGHDNDMKNQVQLLLLKAKLNDVVLHECADKGRTIIDKLIEESNDAGYVIALLSPDDELINGCYRARQNVIFEIGYFLGRLGKNKVRILRKGNVEIPSDLQGILYQEFDDQGMWKVKLLKEMKAAGMCVNIEKVVEKI